VTSQDVLKVTKQRMVKTSGSKASCTYMNASTKDSVSISTATMTTAGAKAAVVSGAHTANVKVQHLHGVGDAAVSYLNVSKALSVATCLSAKNGSFVFLHIDSPHSANLAREAIALCKTAVNRIQ
jgi:hypothetical protein